MTERNPRVQPQDVLNAEDLTLLSREAALLYTSIWHSLDRRQVTTVYLKDEALSNYARVILAKVDSARAELIAAGLILASIAPQFEGGPPGADYKLGF